ncbi:hypothetical protein [Sphingobium sp. D43FB]|uniref:gp53-like domain-containing protein n=1 Tax=Sphingobium sp. D43FB TaxID=2017595 RepID=UPI000BB56DC2|nr:hypothetical protein [Sphingobium sp. D43FB]PBN41501.1 hypothetical protein SxD43FB_21390 [Sphingobium sp. D43FB]
MSDPVTMMVTQAGLAAFLAADAAHPVVITQVGLTQSAFIVAPTIDALPGEFKRLAASFSGDVVSETIIHMTAVDGTADIYDLRGLALYLDDGTLFAVYAQPTPIFTKVSIASFLLALDVAFANGTGNISFGDAIFLLPPATETRAGMARIATNAEADGGTDDQTIISPLKLQRRLTALANALTQATDDDLTALADAFDLILQALTARTITGTGLVTGGGDLTQSRTLDVPAASGAEAIAGTITDKALTPAALRAVQAALSISVSGLATGGGDLTDVRTIGVPAATGAEAIAGTVTDKALTPAALRAVQTALSIGVSGLATGGGDLTEGRTIGVPAATGTEAIAGTATDKALTPAALRAVQAALSIGVSGLATGGGDLTENRTIGVPAATGTEAIAGTATDKALTPAALRAVQAALSIGVSGLATGGGDLTENRTIGVPAATSTEAIAGTATDKALTPAALRAVQAALSIGVSGLATGGGDLTENRTIGVPAATGGETIAGTATDRAITPAALFAFRSAIAFGGGGLVKGGGNLALSRTLTVDAASSADVAAGTAMDKAITPAALSGLARSLVQNGYTYLPGTGGLILQWGRFSAPANTTTNTLFPIAFPNQCFAVTPCGGAAGGADSQDNPPVLVTSGITSSGFAVFSADDTSVGMAYLAIGN